MIVMFIPLKKSFNTLCQTGAQTCASAAIQAIAGGALTHCTTVVTPQTNTYVESLIYLFGGVS